MCGSCFDQVCLLEVYMCQIHLPVPVHLVVAFLDIKLAGQENQERLHLLHHEMLPRAKARAVLERPPSALSRIQPVPGLHQEPLRQEILGFSLMVSMAAST